MGSSPARAVLPERSTSATLSSFGAPGAFSRFALAISNSSWIERPAAHLGNQDLLGLRRLDHTCGDVHVDAEVVAAELARLARVHAGSQARPVARDLDLPHAVASVERRRDGVVRVLEDGHRPVAEVLHDRAVVFGDRLVEHVADLAQQLDRRLVTDLERPRREPDEVREQQRDLLRPQPAAGRPRRGPARPGARPGRARVRRSAGRCAGAPDLAGDHLGRCVPGGRQGVAEPLVARKLPAQPARDRQQLGSAVGLHRPGPDPGQPPLLLVLGSPRAPRSRRPKAPTRRGRISALPSRARARARGSGPFG